MSASTLKKRGSRSSKVTAHRNKLPDIQKLMLDGRAIDRAIALGVRDALIQHQRAGVPVVIWENGKAVHKSAVEVLAELDRERKHRAVSKRAKPKRRRMMPKAA